MLVALDGRSGTGKSTLSKEIAHQVGGVEITADNFWSGGDISVWDRRTPEERSDLAIDWRRLRKEVLEPLKSGLPALYYPFDFKTNNGLASSPVSISPTKIIILDGAYSARPELSDLIDISVLVQVSDDDLRRSKLIEREGGEYMADWHQRWDPAEDYYFSTVRPSNSFDFIITHY